MAAPPLTNQVIPNNNATPLSVVPMSPTFWVVRALSSNSNPLFIGDRTVTTGTGYPLYPGETLEFDRSPGKSALFDLSPADVYVVGTLGGGDVAAWLVFR